MNLTTSERQLSAITSLRANSEWKVVVQWLMENEQKAIERCVSADIVSVQQAQGSAKMLGSILKAIEAAPATLETISKTPRHTR